jgi:hypothetical protein
MTTTATIIGKRRVPTNGPRGRSLVGDKRQARSKVTNGSALLPGNIDGRSTWVRRCRDVIALHLSDLGGESNCSFAERSIIRRIACLTVELEAMESRFAAVGQASSVDLDLYQRTAGNLRRLLEAIGLQRRMIDRTPRLSDILREARHE